MDPYENNPTMPDMPTYSQAAYTINATIKWMDAVSTRKRRTTWAEPTPTTADKHINSKEVPTARTGTHRFNCWWFTDIVANKRTKTTEIASLRTASFSITSAINVSSNVFDNIRVATVSVGANNDAINNESTNVIVTANMDAHTKIPQAINIMDIIVPTQANIIDDSHVRRNDSGRKRKDELNKITGNNKYKNNSGANTNGAASEPDHVATIIPSTTATAEFGIQRNFSIVSHTTIHNNKINNTTISMAAISCSIYNFCFV